MNNAINAITAFIVIIGTYFACKHIENIKLKKQIKLLSALLISWIILRIIKYDVVKDETIRRYIWYLYYVPLIFSANIFMIICTWNDKNKKYIKNLKNISLIVSAILFILVFTNDFHNIVFKFNGNMINCESDYKYGVGYYICFVWIFANLMFGIITAIKASRGFYRKQKLLLLFFVLITVFIYAVSFIKKINFITELYKNFMFIYCTLYMLALMIVVYKEKYRILLEENLYEEIEDAIRDKTILINKLLNNIDKSKNPRYDLAYIKLLIGYCKNKSNLIVTQKNKAFYTSEELKLFIEKILKDASHLGVLGAVNIINNFYISINIMSIVCDFLHNLFEYSIGYKNINILISIEKISNFIEIKTIINPEEKIENLDEIDKVDKGKKLDKIDRIDKVEKIEKTKKSDKIDRVDKTKKIDKIKNLEYNFEITQYINNRKIIEKQLKSEEELNIELKIPINQIVWRENNLTEKEIRAILEIKSKVHDILGQRLSVVSKIVEDENIEKSKINDIKPLLKNILNDLENDKVINPQDMLDKIVYSCELAETKVYIVGKLPKNYIKSITLVKIIRECTTNAIRHAKAKNIYITIIEKDKINMTISNDGNKIDTFCEGDGIKGIRNRVEELNGSLEINTKDDFSVKVVL